MGGLGSTARQHGCRHPGDRRPALSRVKVEPVTEQAAKAAAELLKGAGLHGHTYAIDATVAEVALRQPKPVALLTSDSDEMTKLCGDQVRIIPL
ncbi:hypothetical protein A7J05_17375 [Streptomyces alfalfae]|uniref:DNA-binding protein n=1 Tax=Streptomyces alfalfae TaxID=1642299 RepID=A0ABN4VKN4_9ACTN|nr:hypothetical protein A7J05_17375 [Streptomyces alfalfae]